MKNKLSKFIKKEEFDYEKEKKKIIDNLDNLKSMSVEEHTLYKKWKEFNLDLKKMNSRIDIFNKLKRNLWKPRDIFDEQKTIEDIENLKPVAVLTNSPEWNYLHSLSSTMETVSNPGRCLKFYVIDDVTKKYLGVICLGSDVAQIGPRDKYIGWTKDNKFKDKKLRYTAIGKNIVPTQPLGYNFLGGKLVAALVTSPTVRDTWKEKYGETLVGVTTTSLYGIPSIYNGIPHWKQMGLSAGKVNIKPDDDTYKIWHDWLKENRRDEYLKKTTQKEGVAGPPTGVKQTIINMMFNEVGLKQSNYFHGYQRGVYYSMMYENGSQFFKNEISEDELKMKPKFEQGYDYIERWWKPKAINRYKKLLKEGKLKEDIVWYSDIIGSKWEDVKKDYLVEVGR